MNQENKDIEDKEIIVLDEDTANEELADNSDSSLYPYDPTFSTIEMTEEPFTVFEYLRKLKQGKIITQPDFQRNLVWKKDKKSQFVESIILNFPIPPIYLNETKDGRYMIIDGLQRTTTLQEFYIDGFDLTGLEAIPKYNGEKFTTLHSDVQSKFEDKKLTIFLLKPSTPIKVIYDLFKRINTGGTQLNRQEIRNCIYIGKSTKLLKELSEQPYFKKAIDNGASPKRMKDRELVLRYLAFRWTVYKENYKGDMSNFLENAMKQINLKSDNEIKSIEEDFERVLNIAFTLWGKNSFRIPTASTRGVINMAVFETVCNYLSSQTNAFITKNKSIIKKNYQKLIKNEIYYDSVTRSTNSTNKVDYRFRLAHEILNSNTL